MLYRTPIFTPDTVKTKQKITAEDGKHITEYPAPFITKKCYKIIRKPSIYILKMPLLIVVYLAALSLCTTHRVDGTLRSINTNM
jgi:hypothetical protein